MDTYNNFATTPLIKAKPIQTRATHFFIPIALSLLLLLAPLWGCSREEAPPEFTKVQRKLLLIGIDGATWHVIDPLLKEGKLPVLQKLINNGTRAPLKTLKPTESPRIWNTISTGVLPEVHGIESFVVKIPGTEETTLPSSNLRKVKAFWNILSEYSYTVGVVGWWASFPAEEVNGFVISSHANYVRKSNYKEVLNLTNKGMSQKEERETYPPGLSKEIAGFVRISDDVALKEVGRFANLPEDKLNEYRSLKAFTRTNKLSVLKFAYLSDKSFIESGIYALKKFNPQFFAFYLSGVDAMEHHFWKYLEPEKYNITIPKKELLLYKEVIRNYYIFMDEMMGRLLSLYPEGNTTVIVVSDHGHEANPAYGTAGNEEVYYKYASGYHTEAPDGILVLSGKDIKKGARLKSPSVLDITPTVLALMGLPVGQDMPGKVLKGAISASFFETRPIKTIPTYSADMKRSSTPVKSKMDKELKGKLKALGYIQ